MADKNASPYMTKREENYQKIIAALIHLPDLISAEYEPGEDHEWCYYRIKLRFKNLPDENVYIDVG